VPSLPIIIWSAIEAAWFRNSSSMAGHAITAMSRYIPLEETPSGNVLLFLHFFISVSSFSPGERLSSEILGGAFISSFVFASVFSLRPPKK
jgi:hypothetical protein